MTDDFDLTGPGDLPPPASADLPLDPAHYNTDVAELGLPDAQAQELLAMLWSIMKSFVELGWGVDTLHFVPREDAQFYLAIAPGAIDSPSDSDRA